MFRTLSIFNSKLSVSAIFWAALIIIMVESVLSYYLPPRLFNHGTDRLFFELMHKKYDARIVLIGDSAAGQIISASSKLQNKDFVNLTTNGALELSGQYFLMKRYLERNEKPEAVIFISNSIFGENLGQPFTENYIQRIFLRPEEIGELCFYKGFKFGVVMTFYKLFPSFRYRLSIQKFLTDSANADLHTGVSDMRDFYAKKDNPNIGLLFKLYLLFTSPEYRSRIIHKFCYSCRRNSKQLFTIPTLDKIYLDKLVSALEKEHVRFYKLFHATSESQYKKEARHLQDVMGYAYQLEKKYPAAYFEKNLKYAYPDIYFRDTIHFNQDGLSLAKERLEKEIFKIKAELNKVK